jgi:hypothetical protein
MKAVNDVRLRLTELRRTGPSRAMTELLMSRIRTLLENRGCGDKYPTLRLMCHWSFHDRLRDLSLIYDWLAEVTSALRKMFDNPSSSTNRELVALTRAGATRLNLDGLRTELRTFLGEEHLDTLVVTDAQYWYEFVCGLLEMISERKIGLPDRPEEYKKPAQRYVERIARAPTPCVQVSVSTIEVFVQDGKFKLLLTTTSRMHHVFTVASASPFTEYDAGSLPTTEWADVPMVWIGRHPVPPPA